MTDQVKNPPHYMMLDENVIIDIARTMTMEMWKGACKFCIMKYRLRAGKKDDIVQDIAKADEVERLYEEYKVFCYDYQGVE